MTAHLIPGLSYAEYDAMPGLRWSILKEMLRSPLHCRHAMTADRPDTAAYRIGRAVHCAVLEPDQFNDAFPVRPEFSGKGSVAERKAWEAALAPGATALSIDDVEQVLAMARAVCAAIDVNDAVAREVTAQWHDMDGHPCKARMDLWPGGVIYDIKTTADARRLKFMRDCIKLGYLGQAAWYCEAVRAVIPDSEPGFAFIAVEKSPPYAVAIYDLTADEIAAAALETEALRQRFRRCEAADYWPGYGRQPLRVGEWEDAISDTITFTDGGDDGVDD